MGTYREPSVTSKELNLAQLVSTTGGVQKPAVVATGTNYLELLDQEVVKGASGTDNIPLVSGGTLYSVQKVGSLPGLADYTLGIDYNISGSTIVWITGGPTTGAAYYVSFKQSKPTSYYAAHVSYDINDVRAWHGNELENGEVRPITMAAKMLFDAGASQVTLVQQSSHSDSALTTALTKLETEDIDILLVPGITAQDTSLSTVITHVNKMCSKLEGKERIVLVGASIYNSSTANQITQIDALNNEKIIYVVPPQVTITAKDYGDNKDKTVATSSHYAAASLAGVMSDPNYDAAEPMLRKTLPGITGITNYSRSTANSLATVGALVLNKEGIEVKVRHDLTTYVGDANKEQISVVRAKHYVMKQWRSLLNTRFVGQKLLPETISGMKLASANFLNGLIRDKIINGWRGLTITQDSVEPRLVNLYCELNMIYPICFVDITFGLVL